VTIKTCMKVALAVTPIRSARFLDGMKMNVIDARDRFAREARRVGVVDVSQLGVEDVEDVEVESNARRDLVSDPRIHEVEETGGARGE
jgi:hypothetical protein